MRRGCAGLGTLDVVVGSDTGCLLRAAGRVARVSRGLREVVALKDPVGQRISRWVRPNGLEIHKIRVPIGVIGIIYEARPNVTADAGGIALKSGNAAILRAAVTEAGVPYVLVGDCNQPGDFMTAIRDASMAALAVGFEGRPSGVRRPL